MVCKLIIITYLIWPCSATETLDAEDKFSCDTCGCLQEAQKRIKVKQLPKVLCLHLKRFKYVEDLQRWVAAALLSSSMPSLLPFWLHVCLFLLACML